MISSTGKSRAWQRSCGCVMFLAMLVSMLGTLPFLRRYDPAGPGASLGDGLMLLIWGFGLFGVFIAYFADAVFKRLLAVIAFGWSIAALSWDAVVNACPENVACARDTSDHAALIGACLVLALLLVAYEKVHERLPSTGRRFTKGLAGVLMGVWSISFLLAAIVVNKPIPVAKAQAVAVKTPRE